MTALTAKAFLFSVARIALGVFGGLCLLLYFRQSRMLYFPSRRIAATPADLGMPYEDAVFPTADGERIHGWFVPAERARGTLLMCHGNAGNIGDRVERIAQLRALGVHVFIFDYRGYGRSSGTPSESGTRADAAAAWTYLTRVRNIPPSNIVIHGRSLGGAVAARLAQDTAPAGLILEATFTSVPDMAAHLYPYLPARLLSRFQYDALGAIRNVRCPVLIAHSPDDEIVPFDQGRRLYAAAREPKTFFALSGSHNDGEVCTSDAYRRELDGFLRAVFPPAP